MYFVLIPYQFTTYYLSVLSQQHYLRIMGMTTSCNNSVIDIVYNIDVIIPILKIDSS